MWRLKVFALCASLSVALLGCSSGTDAGAPPPVCVAPGYQPDPAPAPITLELVTATLYDPNGVAIPNLSVQLCGTDKCNYGHSSALGKVLMSPDPSDPSLLQPAFKYGDGYDYAELAIPLSTAAKQDLGRLIAWPLPDYSAGTSFAKKGPIVNGDLTLFMDRADQASHDPLSYPDASQQVFRTVSIPVVMGGAALDPHSGFELAYGVAPLGTTFCPAARLSLKNSLAWPPATEVEVFVQGLDAGQAWAPYGSWVKVADASVSTDGASIDTTSGGIPILSSIAVRRK